MKKNNLIVLVSLITVLFTVYVLISNHFTSIAFSYCDSPSLSSCDPESLTLFYNNIWYSDLVMVTIFVLGVVVYFGIISGLRKVYTYYKVMGIYLFSLVVLFVVFSLTVINESPFGVLNKLVLLGYTFYGLALLVYLNKKIS